MTDDELVERRARRDEHADRAGPAARAPQLLPGRRDGPRIADQHCALQASDVDAQLQRVGAHHASDVSVAKPRLDLAPVQGQVAGAIPAHAARGVEARIEVLPQIAEHHLDRKPAATEDDRLHPRANPGRRNAPSLEHRAAADAQVAVQQRRVVEDNSPLAARGAAAIDERNVLLFEEPRRELARIADRRRCADESRVRPVEGADALQPPDHVRHLAAEQAPIGVELVDDHELEAREQTPPPCVMGQESGMQHVGVGHHDVATLTDGGPAPGWRVAVVGVDPKVDRKPGFERAQLGQLVLCQGLGRIYI